MGSEADGDRSSPNESQLDGSTTSRRQHFWTLSSVRPTPRSGELTSFFEALLRQQQEQADKNKESIQSISTVLGCAVQCFERCARAAERQASAYEALAYLGQQGHFPTPSLVPHNGQSTSYNQRPSTSYNQQWSTSNSPHQSIPHKQHHPIPYNQRSSTPGDTHDTNVSFTSYLNL